MLEKELDLSKCDAASRSMIARDVATFLNEALPFTGDRFSDPTEVWFADVKTKANRPANKSHSPFPELIPFPSNAKGRRLNIATLMKCLILEISSPSELVKVTGWARMSVDEDKLKLVYKTGVGNVKMTKALAPDWQLISELWSGCALELFMCLSLLIIGAIAIRRIITGRKVAPKSQ